MTLRHQEFIVAVDNRQFEELLKTTSGFIAMSFEEFLTDAQKHLTIRQRAHLETDERYRQLLPYIVLYKMVDGQRQYVNYQRTKQVGESRLAGNVSVGFGGHVDFADVLVAAEEDGVTPTSIVFLAPSLERSMRRELEEEIVYTDTRPLDEQNSNMAIEFAGIMLDQSNDVGKVHVGLIIEIQLAEEIGAACKEAELLTLDPATGAELLGSGLPLENWTRIYLEHRQTFADK